MTIFPLHRFRSTIFLLSFLYVLCVVVLFKIFRGKLLHEGLAVSRFTPHELSRVTLRAIREKREDPQLWKAIASRAKVILGQMTPYDVSVVVFGLGLMRFRDKHLLEETAAAIIPRLHSMALNDISHLLAGYARVEVRNDLLFDLSSREIGKKLPSSTSVSEISNLLHSYTQLNYEHPLLFEAIAKRVMLLLPQSGTNTSPMEIAKLVDSFSAVNIPQPKLFAILSSEICRRIDEFPVSGIARIANSYSKKHLLSSNQFLTELILDESFRRRNEFDPISIALLLNAVSKTKVNSKGELLVDYFASDLCKRGLSKFDLQSCVLIARAFSRFSTRNSDIEKLFQLIGDRVAGLADLLTGKHVGSLAKAFSLVGCRHGPLLFNLPNHVKVLIGSMSLAEIASVMHGYASLGIRNDTLLDIVPDRAIALLTSTASVSLTPSIEDGIYALSTSVIRSDSARSVARASVELLEAYSLLLVNNKPLIRALIEKIDEQAADLSKEELVSVVPKCINMLMIDCPIRLQEKILLEAEGDYSEDLTLRRSSQIGSQQISSR